MYKIEVESTCNQQPLSPSLLVADTYFTARVLSDPAARLVPACDPHQHTIFACVTLFSTYRSTSSSTSRYTLTFLLDLLMLLSRPLHPDQSKQALPRPLKLFLLALRTLEDGRDGDGTWALVDRFLCKRNTRATKKSQIAHAAEVISQVRQGLATARTNVGVVLEVAHCRLWFDGNDGDRVKLRKSGTRLSWFAGRSRMMI